jgi:hypothetical protein
MSRVRVTVRNNSTGLRRILVRLRPPIHWCISRYGPVDGRPQTGKKTSKVAELFLAATHSVTVDEKAVV